MLAPAKETEVPREQERRRWDEKAETYDDTRAAERVYQAAVDAAVRSLTPEEGNLVLDAACGTGLTLPAYRNPSVRVVALDLSLESLRRARTRAAGPWVAFVQGDLAALPFAPDGFDNVLCANALQNLPNDGLRRQCVRELARAARPGARVVVSTHNFSALKRRQGWRKERAADGTAKAAEYIYRYERAEFRELLAGELKVKAIRGAGFPLPYRWKLSGASRLLERLLTRWDACADWAHMLVGICKKEAPAPTHEAVVQSLASGAASARRWHAAPAG
jgi:ubiquinone/menaquinone biosynthesis C-methylase UbiE